MKIYLFSKEAEEEIETFRDNRSDTSYPRTREFLSKLQVFIDRFALHLPLLRDKLKVNIRENRVNSKIRLESTFGENSRVTYHIERGEHRMWNGSR